MKIYVIAFLFSSLLVHQHVCAVDILFNNQQNMQGMIRLKGIIPGCTTGRSLRVLYTLQTGICSNWPLYVSGFRLLDDSIVREGMQDLVFSFKHPRTVTTTF